MTRILSLVGLVLAVYWVFLFVAQRGIAFPAPPAAGAPARPEDARQLWLETAAGRTEAWLLPPLANGASAAPLIVFAHGNAELIDYWPDAFEEPRRWGMAVLLVEYPGYGRSSGSPTQRTIEATLEAAYDSAVARGDIDSSGVVLYGRSLGGGAVAGLSRTRPAAALILESSFTSTAALARRFLAPSFLVRDRFDNLAAVRAFRGPKLILHGEHDEVIPTAHGRRLAEAAGVELELMPCGHNDCDRPWPRIHAFLVLNGILDGP